MDYQAAFNVVIGLASGLVIWVVKVVWDSNEQTKKNVAEFQIQIHEFQKEIHSEFVRRDDFKDFSLEIKEMLCKIYDKLDNKADK
jgi:hypothetical protein